MTTAAIKRQNRNGGKPLRLQDAAIKSVLNIPQSTTCDNSEVQVMADGDWLDGLIREAITNGATSLIFGGRLL